MILLTFHWARVVWSRTAVHLAAEEERRRVVAERQGMGLLDSLDPQRSDERDGGDTGGDRPAGTDP